MLRRCFLKIQRRARDSGSENGARPPPLGYRLLFTRVARCQFLVPKLRLISTLLALSLPVGTKPVNIVNRHNPELQMLRHQLGVAVKVSLKCPSRSHRALFAAVHAGNDKDDLLICIAVFKKMNGAPFDRLADGDAPASKQRCFLLDNLLGRCFRGRLALWWFRFGRKQKARDYC